MESIKNQIDGEACFYGFYDKAFLFGLETGPESLASETRAGIEKNYFAIVQLKNGRQAIVDRNYIPATKKENGREKIVEIEPKMFNRLSNFRDGVAIGIKSNEVLDCNGDFFRYSYDVYEVTCDGTARKFNTYSSGFKYPVEGPLQKIYKNPYLLTDGEFMSQFDFTNPDDVASLNAIIKTIILDAKLNSQTPEEFEKRIKEIKKLKREYKNKENLDGYYIKLDALESAKIRLENRICSCYGDAKRVAEHFYDALERGKQESIKYKQKQEAKEQKKENKAKKKRVKLSKQQREEAARIKKAEEESNQAKKELESFENSNFKKFGDD